MFLKQEACHLSLQYTDCVCSSPAVSVRWQHLMMFDSTWVLKEDRWRWVPDDAPNFF